MLCGMHPWPQASTSCGAYKSYRRDPRFLRSVLPISPEGDFVLRRIFSYREADSASLDDLRKLITCAGTFSLSAADVARLSPGTYAWVKKPYLFEDSENCSEESGAVRIDSESTNSLEDDSDDSDEHSNGLHSRSLLAVEEGLRGMTSLPPHTVITVIIEVERMVHPSTPITPAAVVLTTPKQSGQLLAATPAKPASTSNSSKTTNSTSDRSASSALQKSAEKTTSKRLSGGLFKSGLHLPGSIKRIFRSRNKN